MTGIKTVIIATHGTLAEGFKNTLEMICGPQEEMRVMCFYCNKESNEQDLAKYFVELKEDTQLIVCTDIQFGSVNQIFVKEALKHVNKNIHILSGINLPLLLEIATTPGILSQEMLAGMIQKAAKQLIQIDMDALLTKTQSDDLF